MQKNIPPKVTPPYLSVSRLQKTIELISAKNFSEIAVVLFEANGFSKLDANLAISTLKFLGLIDDAGLPTETMSSIRLQGDPRRQAFLKIVERSYEPIFDTSPRPQDLQPVELGNAFRAHYPHLSERVIKTAIPVFLKLCELAGLKEAGSVVSRERKPRTLIARTNQKNRHSSENQKNSTENNSSDFHVQNIVKGKMSISIPEEVFLKDAVDDKQHDLWRSLLKMAHTFADQYIQDETSSPEESEKD